MTRINLVAPSLLVRQHLIAEYRELPRIYQLVQAAIARGETVERAASLSSPSYTLGTGHCRFFYTRLGWLTARFFMLVDEMQHRGYAPAHTDVPSWARSIPSAWWGDWQPTPACVAISVERINTRLVGMGLHASQIMLDPPVSLPQPGAAQ
jgi:deoxyribonuclease (pyrimidine dimer)